MLEGLIDSARPPVALSPMSPVGLLSGTPYLRSATTPPVERFGRVLDHSNTDASCFDRNQSNFTIELIALPLRSPVLSNLGSNSIRMERNSRIFCSRDVGTRTDKGSVVDALRHLLRNNGSRLLVSSVLAVDANDRFSSIDK